MRHTYPFSAIVGQDNLKKALLLNIINPTIGGVLIRGEKGTAKSTAARALSNQLPAITVIKGCPCGCSPNLDEPHCPYCMSLPQPWETEKRLVKVVEIPIGATEDRVVGSLNLESALKTGQRKFEPGLLAEAHRGILYVDEVNLLPDHLVDVLLDVAAMGVNTVEREGVSFSHPSKFVLVGTMNPEEGELRPQFLDRFGLCVEVVGLDDPNLRLSIVKRRAAFDADPVSFIAQWRQADQAVTEQIQKARIIGQNVSISEALLEKLVTTAIDFQVDGHRSDIVMFKAAKTLAALADRTEVTYEDLEQAAQLALPHRLRRQPFEISQENKRVIQFGAR
ncbi:MAG: ATP-binding protein [Deltaproteobacteria bacterium]|nr:ATP-binding protein [Deltaproteobacteria bacterium]